ncbi:Type IIS restriction enzyme Eco57I, partial [termite gut metagenome]
MRNINRNASREIVNYMVDESLISYLKQKVGEELESEYRKLLGSTDESVLLTDVQKDQIYKALRTCKILDPACGSGAFPMGILKRIITIMERLPLPPNISFFDLKLHLIENCIFGVDIQSIAVQISKLRFFISLICEQVPNEDEDNYGIKPLPNLETKFVAANALIGIKPKDIQGNLFEDPQIDVTKHELLQIRHKHFLASTPKDKKECRAEDERLRNKLAMLLEKNNMFAQESAEQLANWNPYNQNSISPFFDPEWMFGLKEGFDIIIGNPPYVQLQNNGGELAKLYEIWGFKTFARTGDIYCLFYEHAYELLKSQGKLCLITSNKWMRAGYGESLRKFFVASINPEQLIDFAGVKVFESATVDVNILLLSKEKNKQQTQACVVKTKGIKELSVLIRQNTTNCSFNISGSWTILSPIEQRIKAKIEAVGTPLKEWNIRINYGIKTGFNDAFIISGEKRKELIRQDLKSEEIIRPILRGRDIKRYGYDFADLWLINTHNGIKEKGVKPIDVNDYPAIKNHLDKYYPKLEKRADKGDTPYNLRNCAYMEDFYKQKIIYPNMTKYMPFLYDNQKCFIITGENIAFLTAFFNSSLFKYCFRDNFPELQGGTRELSKIFFDLLPVLKVNDYINSIFFYKISEIQILRCANKNIKELEIEIDNMIFDLYQLHN